jgi:hypothetical protein
MTFPSGLVVKLPAWTGAWKISGDRNDDTVEYTEGNATLSLDVRAAVDASCDKQEERLGKRVTATVTWEREAPKPEVKRSAWSLPWLAGTVWKASYVAGERFVQVVCVAARVGSVAITLDEPDQARVDRDVADVAGQMLAGVVGSGSGGGSGSGSGSGTGS